MTPAKYCSFCGKPRDEVKRLIDGPTIGICNECIELLHDMLKEPPPKQATRPFPEFREAVRRMRAAEPPK